MTILGFPTPEFVLVSKGDETLALPLNADQRAQYETFCNDLLQRVSVDVYSAMLKASQYAIHGLNGVTLNDSWGQTYHDLISVFTPEDTSRLRPATQKEIDWWNPLC